jgi:hypothetical protein
MSDHPSLEFGCLYMFADFGAEGLVKYATQPDRVFPLLSCNINAEHNPKLKSILKPSVIISLKNGLKVCGSPVALAACMEIDSPERSFSMCLFFCRTLPAVYACCSAWHSFVRQH